MHGVTAHLEMAINSFQHVCRGGHIVNFIRTSRTHRSVIICGNKSNEVSVFNFVEVQRLNKVTAYNIAKEMYNQPHY